MGGGGERNGDGDGRRVVVEAWTWAEHLRRRGLGKHEVGELTLRAKANAGRRDEADNDNGDDDDDGWRRKGSVSHRTMGVEA